MMTSCSKNKNRAAPFLKDGLLVERLVKNEHNARREERKMAVLDHSTTKRRKVVVVNDKSSRGADCGGESAVCVLSDVDQNAFHRTGRDNRDDVECCEFGLEDSLLTIVQQLVRNAEAGVKIPPANHPKGVQERILLLKNEIRQLETIQHRISKLVDQTIQELKKRKEEEMSAAFDTFSPLLSIGPILLSNIMDFMDEGSLFQFERASYTANELAHRCGHWLRLYKLRQSNGAPLYYDNCISRELEARPDRFDAVRNEADFLMRRSSLEERKAGRCRFFGAMADRALRFEGWGGIHYDYNRHYASESTPPVVSAGCKRGCKCFFRCRVEDWDMSQSGATFLRLSRFEADSGNQLVWQGFVPLSNSRSGYDLYLTGRLQWMDWPELKEYFSFLNQSDHYYTAEERSRTLSTFRAMVQKVRVTIVRGDGVLDVVTGGCARIVKHGEAHFHPRYYGDPRATLTTATNLKSSDCPSTTNLKLVKLCFRDRNMFLNVSVR
jgi:hypothetical protein